jgi:similar to stage IV sporulation protein
MLKRLVAFLMGHLRIQLTGGRIERFLNLALQQGIYLWNIERTTEWTRAEISVSDFFALRPVARGAGTRVRILRRHGFPFVLGRVKRRPALIFGAVACVAFIVWATSHVWIIRVKISGPQNLDPRAVEAVAAEAGLRWGAGIGKVDLHKVEQRLQERIGEVSWAVVRLQGTRAVIEIVEKETPRPPSQVGCVNLVARRDGVIEEVVPFQGEPAVQKGDIVKAGSLLVECSFKYWQGGRPMVLPGTEKPPRESTARTLVAQAVVRARITYTRYREIPLVQSVAVPTGRTATRWVLKWNDQPIIARGQGGAAYAQAQEDRKTYGLPAWRNWKLPVELVIVRAREVEVHQEPIPETEAVKQATAHMESQLRWLLGPSDKILTPIRAEVLDRGRDFLGVRTTVETLEEIATPRAGTPLPAPVPPAQTGGTNSRP